MQKQKHNLDRLDIFCTLSIVDSMRLKHLIRSNIVRAIDIVIINIDNNK